MTASLPPLRLLHDDAYQSMPPFDMWVQGATSITTWMVQPGPSGCRGSRLIPLGEEAMRWLKDFAQGSRGEILLERGDWPGLAQPS